MTDEERDQYRHYLAAFTKALSGGVVDLNPAALSVEQLAAAAHGVGDARVVLDNQVDPEEWGPSPAAAVAAAVSALFTAKPEPPEGETGAVPAVPGGTES